ncbi:MAG TPA: MFS transporter, partial [Fimbriimonas sp.]|nr:MFS transporter [Fimbriimonas sp.]
MEAAPAKREQIATRIAFFVTGLSVASWAPLIPLVKAKLALDESILGTLLLCLGLGSVIAMPLSGGLAAHFGCRKVILAAATLALIALPCMALAPSTLTLA